MVLKLYGASISTATKTVAVILNEKNVPFELQPVDFIAQEHKSDVYREKQPFGQFPYIDDDGFILYESRAIARYIEEKYPNQGTKLIPTDPKKKALFEQAASVENNNFHPYAMAAVIEVVSKKWAGESYDVAVYKKHIDDLTPRIEVYDKILAKQRYVAGDELTLADFFHLAIGNYLNGTDTKLLTGDYPNVERWFKEVSSRPSWLAVKGDITSTAASAQS